MKAALVTLLGCVCLLAKDATPEWVRDAAKVAPRSDYPAKVSNLVLLNEEHLTVAPDGKWTLTERGAIRILQPGRNAPAAWRAYNTKTGHIRDFRGWLMLPSGKEIEFPKNRVIDVALSTEYTYDEGRAKMIECDKDAPPGSVFAYEVTEEEDTIFTTYPFSFQESAPVAVSRFVLTLPAGWEARATTINHAEIKPTMTGNTYTWELHDLAWIADEDYRPHESLLAARLGVTYFPSNPANTGLSPLKDWAAVSRWMSVLVDPAAEPVAAVRSKSSELTASSNSELAKIRAIAAFAQQTNYVAVEMNVMKGGGYTPHPASQVLSRNYGDCKDKSALMRALLKAAGIDSYAVSIYSGDRQVVRPEWPSPEQFNHAIVAVKVSPETKLPSIVDHPRLGRLLIFDPTDPVTPVGDLPADEQGSYALVIAGADGDLVKMPHLPAEGNLIERTVDAHFGSNGQLSAHLSTHYFGQSAASMRYAVRHESAAELKRRLERSFSRRLGRVSLDNVTPTDKADENRIELAMDLSLGQFGQFMQEKMLVLRPGTLAPDPDYLFTNKERTLPINLAARFRKDTVTIQMPSGFLVDEMSDPVEIKTAYGRYRASWKSSEGTLAFEQSVEVRDAIVPATEYGQVKDFFDKIASAQGASVVLLKK